MGDLSNLADAKEVVKKQIFIIMARLLVPEGADMKMDTGC